MVSSDGLGAGCQVQAGERALHAGVGRGPARRRRRRPREPSGPARARLSWARARAGSAGRRHAPPQGPGSLTRGRPGRCSDQPRIHGARAYLCDRRGISDGEMRWRRHRRCPRRRHRAPRHQTPEPTASRASSTSASPGPRLPAPPRPPAPATPSYPIRAMLTNPSADPVSPECHS